MSEWRVIVYGVWPDLSPSDNPRHRFSMCFPSESEAREFFAGWSGRARLYWVDWTLGELGETVVA